MGIFQKPTVKATVTHQCLTAGTTEYPLMVANTDGCSILMGTSDGEDGKLATFYINNERLSEKQINALGDIASIEVKDIVFKVFYRKMVSTSNPPGIIGL